jgi:hypothetical protein
MFHAASSSRSASGAGFPINDDGSVTRPDFARSTGGSIGAGCLATRSSAAKTVSESSRCWWTWTRA